MISKDDCVNRLKYMAAYKSLSLQTIARNGLKGGNTPANSQYVVVEENQLEALEAALFYLTGEVFVPPTLPDEPVIVQ